VESGRAVYMMLLNRQQELNIAKSSAIGNVRIIDHAVTDPKPVRPGSILVVVIGFVIGLVFSSAIVILRIFLRRGIESPEQLEELGINVYASIPISEWMAKANINENKNKNKNNQKYSFLALDNPADLAIEAIRSLRTSLHFAMLEARNNILMISGASPSAGKSFVSSNLSAVVVQGGKRVLFIDCDMRKGYLHKVFNVSNDIGMSDILSGKNQFSSA
ncbi:tyrosine-protein kinase, partial [Klebsiella pneumoniae]